MIQLGYIWIKSVYFHIFSSNCIKAVNNVQQYSMFVHLKQSFSFTSRKQHNTAPEFYEFEYFLHIILLIVFTYIHSRVRMCSLCVLCIADMIFTIFTVLDGMKRIRTQNHTKCWWLDIRRSFPVKYYS